MHIAAKKIVGLHLLVIFIIASSWVVLTKHYHEGEEFYTDLLIVFIWTISSLVGGVFSVSIYNKNKSKLNVGTGIVAWLTFTPSLIVCLAILGSICSELLFSIFNYG
jgi:hypothetical protein